MIPISFPCVVILYFFWWQCMNLHFPACARTHTHSVDHNKIRPNQLCFQPTHFFLALVRLHATYEVILPQVNVAHHFHDYNAPI